MSADDLSFQSPCGQVLVNAPTTQGGYWRLEWREHGVRKQTTGGRTRAKAAKKMEDILGRLRVGTAPSGADKVGDILEAYFEHCETEHAANTIDKEIPDLRKALEPYLKLRAEDLLKHQLASAAGSATTRSAFTHRRSRLRAFMSWGYGLGYFTEAQTHALDKVTWKPPKGKVQPPKRDFSLPPRGESKRYVTPDEVPSHDAIAALGDALEGLLPGTGKLCVEFLAATGLRTGEMYAADVASLDLDSCEYRVTRQALSISGRPDRWAPPKGGRPRTTNFPETTMTGFDLSKALERRVEEVEVEHAEGRNPHRLLFPAPRGGIWWATSFTNDFWAAAAETAGWLVQTWTDEKGKTRRRWRHTAHSLRHRFARDRIDTYEHNISELQAVGGWESPQVVWERYYSKTAGLLQSSGEKLRRLSF